MLWPNFQLYCCFRSLSKILPKITELLQKNQVWQRERKWDKIGNLEFLLALEHLRHIQKSQLPNLLQVDTYTYLKAAGKAPREWRLHNPGREGWYNKLERININMGYYRFPDATHFCSLYWIVCICLPISVSTCDFLGKQKFKVIKSVVSWFYNLFKQHYFALLFRKIKIFWIWFFGICLSCPFLLWHTFKIPRLI